MSADRFDELARTLAGETSRRAALKGLAGWAVKGVAVALGVSAAGALSATGAEAGKACSNNCDCPKNQQCTSGRCARVPCPHGQVVCITGPITPPFCQTRGSFCPRSC